MIVTLPADQLRRVFEAPDIQFETTRDLEPCTTIIGQPRGVQAIAFGVTIDSPGYNIYVLGETGTGRATAIQRFVESQASDDPVPPDCLYLFNFQTPHKPATLMLPPGQGRRFREAMAQMIGRLQNEIPRAFDNQTFRDAALEIQQRVQADQEALFTTFQAEAGRRNAALLTTPEGVRITPAMNGQPVDSAEISAWSDEAKAEWKQTQFQLERALSEVLFQNRQLEVSAEQALNALVQNVAGSVIGRAFDELRPAFNALPTLQLYLDQVQQDIVQNIDHFRGATQEESDGVEVTNGVWFRRYEVNVIVDHQDSACAPVVVEYDPTPSRLLGRLEHEVQPGGAVLTDFTLLRGGALHAANGGYLVLRAGDVFADFANWEALKKALLERVVRPDDPAIRSGAATRTLDPQPVPLHVKVILVGPSALYYQLLTNDEDFPSLFKVMADFDAVIERSLENERAYAEFVAGRCQDEGLLPFERAAVGKIIEYGSRLAGGQNKLSTRFGRIADLVREAHYWAAAAGREHVSALDVATAVRNRIYWRNRMETRMRENVYEGKQLIATTGAKVGQINGLTVTQAGIHAFGHPSRLTARTYVGTSGVVQLEREVDMAGPIHNKGVMTLIGYLGGQYAIDQPLVFSGHITFEQDYNGIEGDSASSAELYVLLSSLSGFPFRQDIAVTGSVSQYGEVQPIGGVTEKVEGWFAVCQAHKLTGEQGVLIPAANVTDLMLSDEVVEAVAAGQFHVWTAATIDDGLELLAGRPAAEVHAAVQARLQALAEAQARFERPRA